MLGITLNNREKFFGENQNNNSNIIHKKNITLKEQPNMNTIDDPYNDYQWRYIETHGWLYSTIH